MSRFGSQYKIASATGVCAATGAALEPGAPCVATLCEPEEGDGFDRRDYSVDAWEQGIRPERLFSFWRTTVATPETRRRLLVDDEVLLDLFERLADDERPQRVAFRFVLGLILMRKRRLKFVGRRPAPAGDGGGAEPATEHWLMLPRGATEGMPPFEVANPQLGDEDVRELTAQLGEILHGEFE